MAYWKSKFAKSEANSPFLHVVRSPSTPGSHNWRHEKYGNHALMHLAETREEDKK